MLHLREHARSLVLLPGSDDYAHHSDSMIALQFPIKLLPTAHFARKPNH